MLDPLESSSSCSFKLRHGGGRVQSQSTRVRALVVSLWCLSVLGTAHAQVHYYDLDAAPTPIASQSTADPCQSMHSGCQSSFFEEGSWLAGTRTELGPIQLTATYDFFKFHLSKPSDVIITFIEGDAGLHPAFSLYSGLLPELARDDSTVDPLFPIRQEPSIPECYDNLPSPTDAGGSCLPHDGYRDTASYCAFDGGPFTSLCGATQNPRYAGQFDAFASWSIANDQGDWARIRYLSSVSLTPFEGNDGGTHFEGNLRADERSGATLTIRLSAGDYTIAAGSEDCRSGWLTFGGCSAPGSFFGTLLYSATPVVGAFDVTFSAEPTGYMVDGQFRPSLTLYAGRSYNFNVKTPGHPFYVLLNSGPPVVGNPYATNNGTDDGVVTVNVPDAALGALSSTMAYECGLHPGQEGGLITLLLPPDGSLAVPALPAWCVMILAGLFLAFGLVRLHLRDHTLADNAKSTSEIERS